MSTTLWFVAAAPATASEARGLEKPERARIKGARELLRGLGVRFDRLVHAPLLASLASADVLTPLVDGETACDPRLVVGPFEELLAELGGHSQVVLVAEPEQLARLAAVCVCGDEADVEPFDLHAGAPLRCVGEPRPGGMRITGMGPPADDAAGR